MDQNCCAPKIGVPKREVLTNTLMDTGHILIDLGKLVEELSDKLHGVSKVTAEEINAQELLNRAPGILEIADKNINTARALYARLSELVAKL